MPVRDDDVLNVLNENTQNNNYNQGKTGDDVLGVLNENKPETKALIAAVQSAKVKDYINKTYKMFVLNKRR